VQNVRSVIEQGCPGVQNVRSDVGIAPQARRSRVRFPIVSLAFFIDIILPVALWPGG